MLYEVITDSVLQIHDRLSGPAGKDKRGTDTVMRPGKARIKLKCDLELGDCELVLATQVVDSAKRAVGGGVTAVELDRTARRRKRLRPVFLW